MNLPSKVTLVEVAPRDGLQSEACILPTTVKLEFIDRLAAAGLPVIEATSFVSPKWVPQMADHSEVMLHLQRKKNVHYLALVPNLQGLQRAIAANVTEMAFFTAASERFCQKNTHCSIKESLQRITQMLEVTRSQSLWTRAYISCAVYCPYQGYIAPSIVADLAQQLLALGCHQIALGETIGKATAKQVEALLTAVMPVVPTEQLAVHFHDTYGQALTNIYVSLQQGIHIIDTATAGLGGCPYAPGASGNVATEDVLYLLNGLGIETGVDLEKVIHASQFICQQLQQTPRSRVAQAWQQSKISNA